MWAGLCNVLKSQEKNGAAEWNRTIDLTLTKGMLYRLSYGSISGVAPEEGRFMPQASRGRKHVLAAVDVVAKSTRMRP